MSLLMKAAVGSLMAVQAVAGIAPAMAQTGTAAGAEVAQDKSRDQLVGGLAVGAIVIAAIAVAATGGNDGLPDTSTPVITPPVTTSTTTTTTTQSR